MTAVCSTGNVEQARALGADRVLDYTREDFTARPGPYDVVLDIAGRTPFSRIRRVLASDATVVLVGGKMSTEGFGPLPHLASSTLQSIGRRQKVRFFVAKVHSEDLSLLAQLMAAGKLRSVIDRTFPLDATVEALRYFARGHARGKVVLTVPRGA